jgi:hypothetical protein
MVGNKRFFGVLFIKGSMHAWFACQPTDTKQVGINAGANHWMLWRG